MKRVLIWTALTILLAGGAVFATSNTWTYPVPTGGTLLTTGDIIYARDANNLGNISPSTSGQPLVSGGAGTAPAFGTASLTVGVTGTLPVANGGTNITSYTTGDMLYASTAGALSKLAAVTAGKVIRAAGTSTAPAYSTFTIPDTFATGDLLHGSATNTVTALSAAAAGKLLRAAGASTAPAYSSFTVPDTFTTGDILHGSAANTLTALSAVAAGQLLASAGTSTAPAYTANPTISGYYAGVEIAPPGAGAANSWRLYASDVGGKTYLYAIFGSGAAQVIASEP